MKFKSFLIFIVILTFLLCPANLVLARAGGGGHSGGGGHASSSSSSSGSTGSGGSVGSYGRISRNPISSILTTIIFLAFALFSLLRSRIFSLSNRIQISTYIDEKYKTSKRLILKLSKINSAYEYKSLIKMVSDCFYIVQRAWMERDQSIAKNYMNQFIYDLHESKTSWMKLRHEKNMLEKIKILKIKPVGVKSYKDNSLDNLWFYIKASMRDYTIDDRTSEIIKGSRANEVFIEYWKFTKEGRRWVLSEIRQTDEVDVKNFFDSSSELL